ncbi:hypothetical protein K8I28_04120 [bacterium]|nr:hypothetical protein [bacterium]
MKILLSIVLIFHGLKSPAFASDDSFSQPDTYERIEELADSLRYWSKSSLTDLPELNTAIQLPLDSLTMKELFPGAKLIFQDNLNRIIIKQPTYLETFSNQLTLTQTKATGNNNAADWSVLFDVQDTLLFLDSMAIPIRKGVTVDSLLSRKVYQRILALRTIHLPLEVRAEFTGDIDMHLSVKLRGRDTVYIPFNLQNWLYALGRLSVGRMVYAGILSIEGLAIGSETNYFVLITSPQATGHHFIEWSESLHKTESGWETVILFL